jgi:hypothetical protein
MISMIDRRGKLILLIGLNNLNTPMIHNSRYQVKNQNMKVGVGPIDKTKDLKIENNLVSFEVI